MLSTFISWVVSFFVKKKIEEVFTGWIKDTVDSRDHIFGEKK